MTSINLIKVAVGLSPLIVGAAAFTALAIRRALGGRP